MFAPTIPGKVSNSETNRGAFRRRTTTSRSRVEPRERLAPLCKQGEPCPSATSACRPSAEALVLTLAVRGALGTRWAPDSSCSWWHCGRRWCTLAQLKTSAADHRGKLARASKFRDANPSDAKMLARVLVVIGVSQLG